MIKSYINKKTIFGLVATGLLLKLISLSGGVKSGDSEYYYEFRPPISINTVQKADAGGSPPAWVSKYKYSDIVYRDYHPGKNIKPVKSVKKVSKVSKKIEVSQAWQDQEAFNAEFETKASPEDVEKVLKELDAEEKKNNLKNYCRAFPKKCNFIDKFLCLF